MRLAAALAALALLVAGCPGNEGGATSGGYGEGTSGPAGQVPGGDGGVGAPTGGDPPPTGTGPAGADAACPAGPAGAPSAIVQVRDGNGRPQADVPLKAMREWEGFAKASSDAKGCARFTFQGAGEYQFATDGGGCARQGSASSVWNGTLDLRVSLAVQSVCES